MAKWWPMLKAANLASSGGGGTNNVEVREGSDAYLLFAAMLMLGGFNWGRGADLPGVPATSEKSILNRFFGGGDRYAPR
jgi:hypothetical protein